jgi:alanine racemase
VAYDLANAGYRFPIQHAANSAATLSAREAHLDLVRVGLTLYGSSPTSSMPEGLDLRPAVALRSRVARVMELPVGDGVGYGQTWHAERPTRVALVTAGYADGIPRRLSNRGTALMCGREAPLIGRVSMDMTTFDITDCPGVRVGTHVTFFGRDRSEEIPLARFADATDTIPHEALTLIGGRVARVYSQRGRVCRVARLTGGIEILDDPTSEPLAGAMGRRSQRDSF